MKILLAHLVHSANTKQWYQSVADAACDGLEVVPFGVTLDPPGPRLTWLQLDALWRRKDPSLMRMYERLQTAAADCDVLLLYNGANLHPEMLQYLGTFNVFCCFDDPEASTGLSEPVANAFDAAFYGNVAARCQYQSWGCSKIAWLPIFVSPNDIPSRDQGQAIFAGYRDNDIVICCDRNAYRRDRLDRLVQAFPQASGYGQGWSNGWIDPDSLSQVYLRSRIGWNIHNSTGPINQRLFTLPAYGMMQICDNKTGLGHIFDLGKEAVGFDRVDEAIDATRYYLDHQVERVEIAARGYSRFQRDYYPTRVWERIVRQLRSWGVSERSECERARNPLPARNRVESVRYTLADAKQVVVRWSAQSLRPNKTVNAAIKPIDEQAYLASAIDCNGDHAVSTMSPRCRCLESSRINTEAVAWAITSLLGDGKKIGIVGSDHTALSRLIAIDPSRTVCQIDPPDRSIAVGDHGCDVVIWIDGIRHADGLSGIASRLSPYAEHAIFVVPNHTVDGGLTPTTVYDMLTKHYGSVRLFHMPGADVPWIEPLKLNSQGNPIIACCNRDKTTVPRKAA